MPIEKSEWIWMSGRWVKWEQANVHVTAHALHYGSSAFEGIRAYESEDGPGDLPPRAPHGAAARLLQAAALRHGLVGPRHC